MFLLFVSLSLAAVAQDDDMYFVPTKANEAKEAHSYGLPSNTYYSGSTRSVDEYNRQLHSSVTPIDSAGNDTIDFSAVRGVYPDSTYKEVSDEDYKYTRRLVRFDDYTLNRAYWDGYRDGQWDSPWYYSSWSVWYDDPWYWGDPWYYRPWHWGWYGPWHYRWHIYRPYWRGWGRGGRYYASRPIRRTTYTSSRSFGGRSYGGRSTSSSSRSFGSIRSYGSSSFGGGRSSSFSGGRSGGFGGGRSASGGRSYGGRR